MLVIDASIAAAWIYDDEQSTVADRAMEQLTEQEGIAPVLWQYEIRNLLLMGVRRGRIDAHGMHQRLQALETLPIAIDHEAGLPQALALAEKYRLSFYDALYLELTDRCGGVLATLDKKLATAAREERLPCIGAG